jgi:hypothetical protein
MVLRSLTTIFKPVLLTLLPLIVSPDVSYCQRPSPIIKSNIKFSPLHLINSFPTIQLGYERNLPKKFSINLEAGHVVGNPESKEYPNKRGKKFREEIRYYYKFNPRKENAFYGAFDFFQNYLRFDESGTINLCDDLECLNSTKIELGPQKVKLNEKGFGIRMGVTEFSGRFIFDFNWGVSFRWVTWHRPFFKLTPDTGTIGLPIEYFIRDDDNHFRIFPSLGIRIGYLLKKIEK